VKEEINYFKKQINIIYMRGYGIDENVKSEGTSVSTLNVGINENILLKNVSYGLASRKEDADPNGPKALCFEFTTKDGESSLLHFEWEVNEQREIESAERLYDTLVSKGGSNVPKETKAEFVNSRTDRAFSSQATRIKHIMTKFMSEEEAVVPMVNSFAQFGQMVEKMLKPRLDDRKLRLICVYNYKGYVTLPTFTPFVENMVDGVSTSLKINLKYHKLELPKQDNPATAASAVSDNDEF
jgi:hypothetical protein